MKGDSRSFTTAGSGIGYEGGRYISNSPTDAASKAGRKLWERVEKDKKYSAFKSRTSIKLILRETTAGSNKKSYYYNVSREAKKTPTVFKRGNVEIVSKWNYVVKSCDS